MSDPVSCRREPARSARCSTFGPAPATAALPALPGVRQVLVADTAAPVAGDDAPIAAYRALISAGVQGSVG